MNFEALKLGNVQLGTSHVLCVLGQVDDQDISQAEYERIYGVIGNSKKRMRAEILEANQREIKRQNDQFQRGKSTFFSALNEMDELNSTEIKARKMGLLSPPSSDDDAVPRVGKRNQS